MTNINSELSCFIWYWKRNSKCQKVLLLAEFTKS